MTNKNKVEVIFPVGFHKFHKNKLFNFTLNRWHSIGYAKYKDMLEAGKRIKSYEDWKTEMIKIAEKALNPVVLFLSPFLLSKLFFPTSIIIKILAKVR